MCPPGFLTSPTDKAVFYIPLKKWDSYRLFTIIDRIQILGDFVTMKAIQAHVSSQRILKEHIEDFKRFNLAFLDHLIPFYDIIHSIHFDIITERPQFFHINTLKVDYYKNFIAMCNSFRTDVDAYKKDIQKDLLSHF